MCPIIREADKMVLNRRFLLTGLATLPLAACGATGEAPPATFDLSAAREGLRGRAGTGGQLMVEEPSALQVYDSERIVAKSRSQGLTYLPKAQWADRLPRLVQTRMIQTFENSNRFSNIGRPGDDITPDLKLVSEIRAFEADEASRSGIVQLSIKLVSGQSGRIQRGQLFGANAPINTIDGQGTTVALDQALGAVLVDIVSWV
jgi:cholesterol transport system auxiliary component